MTNFHTKRNLLTPYAFRCGYTELRKYTKLRWADGCYFLHFYDACGIYMGMRAYRTLALARKAGVGHKREICYLLRKTKRGS